MRERDCIYHLLPEDISKLKKRSMSKYSLWCLHAMPMQKDFRVIKSEDRKIEDIAEASGLDELMNFIQFSVPNTNYHREKRNQPLLSFDLKYENEEWSVNDNHKGPNIYDVLWRFCLEIMFEKD